MNCSLCRDVVERSDVPHVVRICPGCGRELRIYEPGEHGRGFKVQAGDRIVVPEGWLKLSANPLRTTGAFTRAGLEWFAKLIFVDDLPAKEADFDEELDKLERYADDLLQRFPLLHGLELENPEHAEQIIAEIREKPDSREWFAFWTGLFVSVTKNAISEGQPVRAAWAAACAERLRAMLVFKEHLEEVVWMGQSAKRLIDILTLWDQHKQTDDEEFWQTTFKESTYVLSQIFAVPVVFIQDKAYVGGMKIDRSEGRFVDYLFSAESSREAVLIEIKTPSSKLLGSEYRGGIYSPSAELSGAITQLFHYRSELVRNLKSILEETKYDIAAFNPKCVLLLGDAEAQLTERARRRSFELFRGGLRDVEIVTYDELFRKVEVLAQLFRLIRTKPNQQL